MPVYGCSWMLFHTSLCISYIHKVTWRSILPDSNGTLFFRNSELLRACLCYCTLITHCAVQHNTKSRRQAVQAPFHATPTCCPICLDSFFSASLSMMRNKASSCCQSKPSAPDRCSWSQNVPLATRPIFSQCSCFRRSFCCLVGVTRLKPGGGGGGGGGGGAPGAALRGIGGGGGGGASGLGGGGGAAAGACTAEVEAAADGGGALGGALVSSDDAGGGCGRAAGGSASVPVPVVLLRQAAEADGPPAAAPDGCAGFRPAGDRGWGVMELAAAVMFAAAMAADSPHVSMHAGPEASRSLPVACLTIEAKPDAAKLSVIMSCTVRRTMPGVMQPDATTEARRPAAVLLLFSCSFVATEARSPAAVLLLSCSFAASAVSTDSWDGLASASAAAAVGAVAAATGLPNTTDSEPSDES